MQTIVWTRDLSKVDPREIEACEDLLDAYFLMVGRPLLPAARCSRVDWSCLETSKGCHRRGPSSSNLMLRKRIDTVLMIRKQLELQDTYASPNNQKSFNRQKS